MIEDFTKRKREGLGEIKDKFNSLAQQVKIDATQVKEAFKKKEKQLENIEKNLLELIDS